MSEGVDQLCDDSSVLAEVERVPDFVRRALFDESFSDWPLLLRLARFLMSVDPNSLCAHLFLVRSLRCLGRTEEAQEALDHCSRLLLANKVAEVEAEGLREVLASERTLLSRL